MPSLKIRTSIPASLAIAILGVLVGGVIMFIGVVNLIHPDVPEAYLAQNAGICLVICLIALAPLLLAVAAFRGLLSRRPAPEPPSGSGGS